MSNFFPEAPALDARATPPDIPTTSEVEPYSPTVSDIVPDPEKMLKRQLDLNAQELTTFTLYPPGTVVPGTGPEVFIGLDAEWVHDPITQTNRILSVQFHVVGETGEFQHISYVRGSAKTDRPQLAKLLTEVIVMALEDGAVLEWPKRIIVAAFFLRADLTAFSDLARYKHQFDSVGRSVGTRGRGITFDADLDPQDMARLTQDRRFIVDEEGRRRELRVSFIDLVRHVPVGTTLADVGALLEQPKIELPPGTIEHMDDLLRNDPDLYAKYAAQDALIAVYYLHRLKETIKRLVGPNCLPLTSSGVSLALFKKTLLESGLDFRAVFGTQQVSELCWHEQTGKLRTIKHEQPVEMRSIFAEFVIKTAHGGRGECFYAGPTPVSTFYDIDISSAYTVALSMLGLVNYENPWVSLNAEDYRGHVLGFALVRVVHCPQDIRFPVFPVEGSGQNLMFPRLGKSYCTAAEIEVALNLGYQIEILHGVIYPWLDENVRPFEPFVTTIRDERAKHPKGSFDNEYIKLVGNGLFGKTGQGLKEKRVFDTGELKSVALDESPITNELFFSFVMGFVRALIAELMNSVPRHRRIVSVTTDGFLTDAPLEDVDQTGPIATRFKAATERVAPGAPILEVKHKVSQILSARIRAQFTAVTDPDPHLPEKERIVLAKGNVTPDIVLPEGEVSKAQIKALQNNYMVELYLKRTPESKTLMRPFVSLRQQWLDDLDIFRIERPVRLGLEFDMKRRPVNPQMLRVGETNHIAFDTEPWDDLETAEKVRAIFTGWRRSHCLKTMEDWTHWQDFVAGAVKRRNARQSGRVGIHRTAEGEIGILRRVFLRAYAQQTWGLTREMSYAALAEWLTNEGYPTTETEIKNAARAKIVENVVPLTSEVTQLLTVLSTQFPSMDLRKYIGDIDMASLDTHSV